MALHCATLAKAAGGVNGFIIGSEFVTLNHIRSGIGTFPAPNAFAALANEVQSVLGPSTVLTYAADWTEYGGYSPKAGELRFPLDVLWSHPAIGAVGIDAYWPVSDWRDGNPHLDLGPPTAKRNCARRSATAASTSRGCGGPRMSKAGGPIRMSND